MARRVTKLEEANQKIAELRAEIKSLREDLYTERKRAVQALNVAEHSSTAISAMATTQNRLNRSLDELMCKLVHQA